MQLPSLFAHEIINFSKACDYLMPNSATPGFHDCFHSRDSSPCNLQPLSSTRKFTCIGYSCMKHDKIIANLATCHPKTKRIEIHTTAIPVPCSRTLLSPHKEPGVYMLLPSCMHAWCLWAPKNPSPNSETS